MSSRFLSVLSLPQRPSTALIHLIMSALSSLVPKARKNVLLTSFYQFVVFKSLSNFMLFFGWCLILFSGMRDSVQSILDGGWTQQINQRWFVFGSLFRYSEWLRWCCWRPSWRMECNPRLLWELSFLYCCSPYTRIFWYLLLWRSHVFRHLRGWCPSLLPWVECYHRCLELEGSGLPGLSKCLWEFNPFWSPNVFLVFPGWLYLKVKCYHWLDY